MQRQERNPAASCVHSRDPKTLYIPWATQVQKNHFWARLSCLLHLPILDADFAVEFPLHFLHNTLEHSKTKQKKAKFELNFHIQKVQYYDDFTLNFLTVTWEKHLFFKTLIVCLHWESALVALPSTTGPPTHSNSSLNCCICGCFFNVDL